MTRIKSVLIYIVGVSALSVCFHDDGIPSVLSESDKVYVSQQIEASESRMKVVIEEIEQFIADPANEDERSIALAAAIDSWYEIGNRMNSDGRFFVSPVDEFEKVQSRRVIKLNHDLETLVSSLTEELLARVAREEYSPEAYETLRHAFSQGFKASTAKLPCSRERCFWCRCRRIFPLYLL